MRRGPEVLRTVVLAGLAFALSACQSESGPWTPPEEHPVKLVSGALFVRTSGGDYVDGYFAEYESDFERHRIFMALELTPYAEGDRILITGRPSGDSVRRPAGDLPQDPVPVFEVETARPDIPKAPDIPPIKSSGPRGR